ncbi:hypothetical protein IFM89_001206 [Coptis chinensis]|uniref:Protein kinase domain-containing protein n=1 Tax=Coptis chinensis TaxID=261450 RepID=A0A835HIF7_9MAGN|nr:hypothetical protein IFM89_001206 [Coptis chinensis]
MLLLPDYRLHGEACCGNLDLLAKCLEAGETVAIKKVLQDRRYKNRELQLMRSMDHPNVVSLKHCFFSTTTKNELFLNLVMEYVPKTVYRVLRHYSNVNQRMPLIYVKLYMYQIFRGLAYIHTVHGVSHKDVKPQNLLVSDLRSCLGFSQTDQLDAKHVGRDGLAAGKGVVVAMTLEEAYEAVDSMLVDRGCHVRERCLGVEFRHSSGEEESNQGSEKNPPRRGAISSEIDTKGGARRRGKTPILKEMVRGDDVEAIWGQAHGKGISPRFRIGRWCK